MFEQQYMVTPGIPVFQFQRPSGSALLARNETLKALNLPVQDMTHFHFGNTRRGIQPLPVEGVRSLLQKTLLEITAVTTAGEMTGANNLNQTLTSLVEELRSLNRTWRTSLGEHLPPDVAQLFVDDMQHEILGFVIGLSYRRASQPDFGIACQNVFEGILDAYERYQTMLDNGLGNQKYPCRDVFSMAIQSVTAEALRKNLEVTVNSDALNRNLQFFAKNYHLYLIFSNLLQNSVKYTPDGGKVDVDFKVQDGYLVLSVTDTGIGIPPTELTSVLSGQRASNAIETGIPGTGYGLKRVYNTLCNLNGSMEIDSPVHRSDLPGTKITCRIPISG